jgi:hypothetical protein
MAGKGFDYYRNTYTHQELWRMLFQGDDWSVRQAGSLWRTAKGGLERSRDEMTSNVVGLRSQWTGDAAEEFERRLASRATSKRSGAGRPCLGDSLAGAPGYT